MRDAAMLLAFAKYTFRVVSAWKQFFCLEMVSQRRYTEAAIDNPRRTVVLTNFVK